MSVQDQKPAWVVHFKITDASWDELLRDAANSGCQPLALACERGLVNESELLLTEQVKSELPVLSANYFETVPSPDIFTNRNFKECKAEGVLPLSPWEGHTLFAKMTGDVTDFQTKIPDAIFVLA